MIFQGPFFNNVSLRWGLVEILRPADPKLTLRWGSGWGGGGGGGGAAWSGKSGCQL